MQGGVLDAVWHVALLLVYALAGAAFAGIGLVLEYNALVGSSDAFVTAWLAALGLLMFAFSYLIFTDKTAKAYSELRSQT